MTRNDRLTYRYDEQPTDDIQAANTTCGAVWRSTWFYVCGAFYRPFTSTLLLMICIATIRPPATFLYTLLVEYLEVAIVYNTVSLNSFTDQLVIGYDCMISIWIAVTTKPIWGQY